MNNFIPLDSFRQNTNLKAIKENSANATSSPVAVAPDKADSFELQNNEAAKDNAAENSVQNKSDLQKELVLPKGKTV